MRTLTDKQYEEYKNLKKWAKREKVWTSLKGIQRLEDDVDIPIKKCVAMFALLGLEPLFSCCGFDYHGQPYHKSHQYGEAYIMSRNNSKTQYLLNQYPNLGAWTVKKHVSNTVIFLLKVQGNPYWRKKDCIHFSEELVLGISWMEKWLINSQNMFADSITLFDTNQNYKKQGVRHWQYIPKEPWTITKELLNTY